MIKTLLKLLKAPKWGFSVSWVVSTAQVNRLLLLVGDKEVDPLLVLDCLDFVLLIVCTCSRTRCCPDRYWLTDGTASEVSSTLPMAMTDFSGSKLAIFPPDLSVCGPTTSKARIVRQSRQLRSVCVVCGNKSAPCPALPCPAPWDRTH